MAQAALLRIFDIKQAAFTMKLLAVWENDEVETLAEDSDDEEEEGEDAPGECRGTAQARRGRLKEGLEGKLVGKLAFALLLRRVSGLLLKTCLCPAAPRCAAEGIEFPEFEA